MFQKNVNNFITNVKHVIFSRELQQLHLPEKA